MTNRVYINSLGIITIEVVGDQTPESIQLMGEDIAVCIGRMRQAGRPVLVLDDIKRLGETTPAARSEVAQLARDLPFDRCAMVGDARPFTRHGVNLMLRAIGRPTVRYFASYDAAMMWLRDY